MDKGVISDLPRKPRVYIVESPSSWCPSVHQVFKVNFDGVAKGYGGVCRNCNGEILQVFHGSIGHDTNNSVELEGLIQGVQLVIRHGWFLSIVEGDSRILIHTAHQLVNGKSAEKVASS